MLSPLPPAVGQKRFISKLVCRNDKSAVRLRVTDVNNSKIPTSRRLAYRHAGAVSPGTILSWIVQDFLHLFLFDLVIPNVRLISFRIEVETKIHRHQYRN